jgi:S-formylglutathione hydrolase FrmB
MSARYLRNRRLTHFTLLFFLHLAYFSYAADQSVVTIAGSTMGKKLKATVVLPDSYARTKKHFPVIYLLHGYSGDHTTFPRAAPLADLADRYQVMFVCPSAENSWYIDSPEKTGSRFETYIASDVVTFIDKTYRTWPRTEGRALVGSSMGGHGAITLLERHPDKFSGAGAIAGIMDITEFPHEWEIESLLGPFSGNTQRWIDYSALGQIGKLRGSGRSIILDCGAEDFALQGNRKAHTALLAAGIPHDYYERPGGHDLTYVNRVLEFHVLFFCMRLLKAG